MLKFFSSPLDPDEFVTKLKDFVDKEEIDPATPRRLAANNRSLAGLTRIGSSFNDGLPSTGFCGG